jgi:glycosyltransferase involved in cell wall biosynthesis
MIPGATTISVILTAFRRTEFLRGAIESVLAQTLQPTEILVTDDSANAEIEAITQSYRACGIVRYRSNREPLGAAGNVRAALAECSGSLVGVLNDDDLWEPTLLYRLAAPFERSSDVVLAFSDHWVIDASGTVDMDASRRFSESYGRSALSEGLLVNPARTAVITRSVPVAICALFRREVVTPELIPPEVRGAYDFWIAALAAASGRPFYYAAAFLGRYRVHAAMESRRSVSGSEGHRSALAEILQRGWFPSLRGELRRKWADVCCDCALESLGRDETSAARASFMTSLASRPSLRALAGLGLSLLPKLARRGWPGSSAPPRPGSLA